MIFTLEYKELVIDAGTSVGLFRARVVIRLIRKETRRYLTSLFLYLRVLCDIESILFKKIPCVFCLTSSDLTKHLANAPAWLIRAFSAPQPFFCSSRGANVHGQVPFAGIEGCC